MDSGPLVALLNRNDRWHAEVLAWLLAHPDSRLVTTWAVLTEVCALLAKRVHNEAALDALRWVQRGAIEVDVPPPTTVNDVLAISECFRDLPFDLAEASIAEAAARLKIGGVLSIGADLDVYRDTRGHLLVNALR